MGWIRKAGRRVCLAACAMGLAFGLAACQKQPTWQEQYDLGMRYLTESNYEEAILAFTAAIEIDPNQPDTYVYLIQTYLATGDVEKAEATRLQGYEATGNIRLGQSVSSGWIIYDDDIPFEQRITYRLFDALSAEQQEAIQALLTAIQTDERETVRELLLTSGLPPQLCTTLDGYKINISIMQRETLGEDAYQTFIEQYYRQIGSDIDTNVVDMNIKLLAQAEIRPENGIGYLYTYSEDGVMEIIPLEDTLSLYTAGESLRTAECDHWQYNGIWKITGSTFEFLENQNEILSSEQTGIVNDNVFLMEATSTWNKEGLISQTVYERGEHPGDLTIRYNYSSGMEITYVYRNNMLSSYTWRINGELYDFVSGMTEEERMLDKDPGVVYIAERF